MSDNIEASVGQSEIIDVPATAETTDPREIVDHVARTQALKVKAKEATAEKPETNKPWESKDAKEEKGHTPRWARERLREMSGSNRELKGHVEHLTQTVQNLLKQVAPQTKDLKEEDFPTKADYIKHVASQAAQETVSVAEQARAKTNEAAKERETLDRADAANVKAALQYAPDYHDAIAEGDPELTMPTTVIKHLSLSPAGPLTRYRIAKDVALSEELKGMTPQAKIARVSQVHDEILDWMIKQGSQGNQATQQGQPAAASKATTQAPRKAAPQAAPPRAKGGNSGSVNPLSMSGDDFVRHFNDQKKHR